MERTEYVRRDLEAEIGKYVDTGEIIAVVGPRQCGKTTMINRMLDGLEAKGKSVSRVSFDDQKVLRLFESDIDSFVELHVKGRDVLFIDEVHYSKDSGKRLKYIHDSPGPKTKIFISGSSAPEMSIYSLKYLAGRILTFTLHPFSFREFLRHRDAALSGVFEKRRFGMEVTGRLNRHLEEYILFGGFPRVVLSGRDGEKKKVLEGIFNTYLLREIREILGISDDYRFMELLKYLSLQTGNIISYSELSKMTGCPYAELKRHLNVLQKTFICGLVKPFYTNKRTELVKNPKVYFLDTGFRNACIDNFSTERTDKGSLYENFVFSELAKRAEKVKFWNTKSSAEVDFVVEKEGKCIPVEVKARVSEAKATKSYGSFISRYSPEKGYFLSLDFEGKANVRGCEGSFVPFVKFASLRES